MSADVFWDLFAETGDIAYYLLYTAASAGEKRGEDEVPEPPAPNE